ncbi:hypothetical protein DEU35_3047 [Microbacterium sp. AG157]|uniref:hypothetical protein n=1 Tax=Microbacterium sp. AG157 TaxID=2183993 RepID=UPI000E367EFD|nr:hypothetical protein [Microbacterium sp. AG157]REC97282.1 hypothetical protein DEU35_3047 [Microbacterium sp. AG157]
MPAKRHAARVIHPFRTSGVNSPGYSQRPQQAPVARQRHEDDWDYDAPMTVDLGTPNARSLSHFLAAQATAARWAPVPSVSNGQPSVRVRVGGVPVVLPAWEIFIGRSTTGVETAYGLDDSGVLHLVMLRGNGEPAEMVDVPDHVLDHLRDWAFPGSTS